VSETSVREVAQAGELLKVASLDAPTNGEDEGTAEVERLDAGDFCPEQLGVEDRLLLEHALSQLRDLEREVLLHFHVDSMNQSEIAAKLDISPNYVSHILRQSLTKLRKILSAEEEKDRLLRRQAAELDFEVLDPQTGAYTEAYFRNRLEEEIHRASCEDRGVALVLVEFRGLDGLRRFYGEQSVLDFLADAADFFKETVRRLDIVARYGNTGFAIVLPETGHNVTLVRGRLLDKIAAWMAGHYAGNGGLTVNLGLAGAPTDGRTSADLLRAATPRPFTELQLAA
jgi:RNA polymerase sigma-B factor